MSSSDYPLKLLIEMLKIYSPSGKEEELSAYLQAEMKGLGFFARVDDAGNVIGEIGKGGPTILLCGHMDTVPGEAPVRVEGDYIHGRGAVDAKSSLASMILAASRLGMAGVRCKLIVAALVDEEGSSRGAKQLVKDKLKIDYAIFGEPSGVEGITVGYKGSLHLKLAFSTRTAHSASHWLAENAIEEAFKAWRLIREAQLQDRLSSRFYSLTGCITKIAGGTNGSLVPSECILDLDLRVPPGLTTQKVMDDIGLLLDSYGATNPNVKVRIKIIDRSEPYEASSSSDLVKAFRRAIRRVRGVNATLLRKTGSSDMNILGHAYRIPMIAYGPGDSRLDHTPDERVKIADYLDSIRVYEEAIRRLVDLNSEPAGQGLERASPTEGQSGERELCPSS